MLYSMSGKNYVEITAKAVLSYGTISQSYIHTPLIFCAFQPGIKVKVSTKLMTF
jgi:hypothetical protein